MRLGEQGLLRGDYEEVTWQGPRSPIMVHRSLPSPFDEPRHP